MRAFPVRCTLRVMRERRQTAQRLAPGRREEATMTVSQTSAQQTTPPNSPGSSGSLGLNADADTPASATLRMNEAVAARRAAGQRTIHLGFGEASFPLPR